MRSGFTRRHVRDGRFASYYLETIQKNFQPVSLELAASRQHVLFTCVSSIRYDSTVNAFDDARIARVTYQYEKRLK